MSVMSEKKEQEKNCADFVGGVDDPLSNTDDPKNKIEDPEYSQTETASLKSAQSDNEASQDERHEIIIFKLLKHFIQGLSLSIQEKTEAQSKAISYGTIRSIL